MTYRSAVVSVATLLVLAGCDEPMLTETAVASKTADLVDHSAKFGINVGLLDPAGFGAANPEHVWPTYDAPAYLSAAYGSGIRWIRMGMHPVDMIDTSINDGRIDPNRPETIRADYTVQAAAAAGMAIHVNLSHFSWTDHSFPNLQKWSNFVSAVVQRYGNDVKYYAIWNEPNCGALMSPSNPSIKASGSEYAQLVIAAAPIIHAAGGYVIAGENEWAGEDGQCYASYSWMQALASAANGSIDAYSMHKYAQTASDVLSAVQSLRNALNAMGIYKPIWLTEYGLSADSLGRESLKYPDAVAKSDLIGGVLSSSLFAKAFPWHMQSWSMGSLSGLHWQNDRNGILIPLDSAALPDRPPYFSNPYPSVSYKRITQAAGGCSWLATSTVDAVYRVWVQGQGWTAWATEGEAAGTTGQALAMTKVQMRLSNSRPCLGLVYRIRNNSYGWSRWFSEGETAMFADNSQIEQFQAHLRGDDASGYGICYYAHVTVEGWLSNYVRCNGGAPGTDPNQNYTGWSTGQVPGFRMEALKVWITNPPPSPTPQIAWGPNEVRPNVTCSWEATASGGTPPYTFEWYVNSVYAGSGTYLEYTNAGSTFTLQLTVRDASSGFGSTSQTVTVNSSAPVCFL